MMRVEAGELEAEAGETGGPQAATGGEEAWIREMPVNASTRSSGMSKTSAEEAAAARAAGGRGLAVDSMAESGEK
jgi:hypothetical protein